MLKNIKFYITILIVLMSAVFSFGLIKANEKVAAGGIFVGENATIDVAGGLFDSDDKAIVITGGEHTLRNMVITGSTNGAIHLSGGVLNVINCHFIGNSNENNGGAIFVGEGATLNIVNSKIKNNNSAINGGAIYAAENSRVNISGNTVISGNTASIGGGIYLAGGALLNNGTSGLEFFTANKSTSNSNIWQNVYYYEMDIKYELEGIINLDKIYKNIENIKTSEVPNIDFSSYHDYYTFLPYANASDDKIIGNINYINEKRLDLRPNLEGFAGVYHYGENKIKYTRVSNVYHIEAARKVISGKLVLQANYNNLPVEVIKTDGFRDCNKITGSLNIPDSVKTIRSYAFYGCKALSGTLTIGNSVKSIGEYAFYNLTGLRGDLKIPDSVNTIGNNAFDGCKGFINSLVIPDSVTYIGNNAFDGCQGFTNSLVIPGSVTYIGRSAFYNCTGFNGVLEIQNGVQSIGAAAFCHCPFSDNDKLTIPASVLYIGEAAFAGCCIDGEMSVDPDNTSYYSIYNYNTIISNDGLLIAGTNNSKVSIMDGITRIGAFAFYKCSGLKGTLKIPYMVQSIGNYAFYGCSGLTSLTFDIDEIYGISLQVIGRFTFYGCSGFGGELNIPETVEKINEYAFANCRGFTSLTFGQGGTSNLTNIGNGSFYGCSGFTGDLYFPGRVNSIGNYAFYGCSGFQFGTLNIPASVSFIGEAAFAKCFVEGTMKVSYSNRYYYSSVYDYDTGTRVELNCIIQGHGNFNNYNPGVLIAGTNTTLISKANIHRIGERAFVGCSYSRGVFIIPEEIDEIGKFAFYNFDADIYFEMSGLWFAETQDGAISEVYINASQNYRETFERLYYREWYRYA